jgi:hypothetical protein
MPCIAVYVIVAVAIAVALGVAPLGHDTSLWFVPALWPLWALWAVVAVMAVLIYLPFSLLLWGCRR